MIGLTFFNEGNEFMLTLAVTVLYFTFWHAEPSTTSLHIALIMLPEGLAVAFGLLSDSTDVCGLKKRFYIVIAALL